MRRLLRRLKLNKTTNTFKDHGGYDLGFFFLFSVGTFFPPVLFLISRFVNEV